MLSEVSESDAILLKKLFHRDDEIFQNGEIKPFSKNMQ